MQLCCRANPTGGRSMTKLPEEIINKHPNDIAERIAEIEESDQVMAFMLLPGHIKAEVFSYLLRPIQENILQAIGNQQIADLLETMPPDDRTDVFEDFPDIMIKEVVNLLSKEERQIALTLIGYATESVGRMMTPLYIQVRQEWTVKQTLQHIKKNGRKAETLNFVYVVDENQVLIDDIRIGLLLMAEDTDSIASVMDNEFVALNANMHNEEAITIFEKYDRSALPVISDSGVLVGIVTADDMLDQVAKRDTEDIQKFGGLEALDLPYLSTGVFDMVKKRAGWLVILFLSEMLTASAMGYFDQEISKAVVLALFVPLIISSGGNSGSQAATLIIRALAIKELTLADWWYVMRREIISGLSLGVILATIGFIRIFIWQKSGLYDYGPYWISVGLSVSFSLIFIVLWGTLSGSMIPFVLKKCRLDPATSSAPFVATLVDVTGLIIYFTIAAIFLNGKLL